MQSIVVCSSLFGIDRPSLLCSSVSREFRGLGSMLIGIDKIKRLHSLSPIIALTFRGASGSPTGIPAPGLERISSNIPRVIGPGDLNTSPASRLGVIAASVRLCENVFSSRWLTEDPPS